MDILIVDDSRSMRMLIKRSMRQAGFANYTVEEAENGVEGLAKLAGHKQAGITPKLILSDWNMMEMGGEEFAREVRARDAVTAFGFITSEASAEIHERAMAAGANFLLTKPFDSESIGAALEPYLKAA